MVIVCWTRCTYISPYTSLFFLRCVYVPTDTHRNGRGCIRASISMAVLKELRCTSTDFVKGATEDNDEGFASGKTRGSSWGWA